MGERPAADRGAGLDVRAPRAQELAAADRIAASAFSAAPPPDEQDRRPRAPRPAADLHRVVVGPLGGAEAVLATATARLRGQWFGGRRLPSAALSGVAVHPTRRGRGVGRHLLAGTLAAARQAGAVVCSLIPSTQGFYDGAGAGVAGRRPVFALSTAELRTRLAHARDVTLRPAVAADAAAVAALAAARARRGNGFFDHDDPTGEADDPSGGASYVAERGGAVVGWCRLGRRPTSRTGAAYVVVVQDLVGADPGAETALWRELVADVPSALRAEGLLVPGGPLERQLERQVEVVEDGTWMLRMLDVDAALAGRGYPVGLSCEVVLAVTDPLFPANDGVRALWVEDGRAHVRPAPCRVPDVEVTVGVLASLFCGHLDPVVAHHEGVLTGTASSAERLRPLFAGPPATLGRAF